MFQYYVKELLSYKGVCSMVKQLPFITESRLLCSDTAKEQTPQKKRDAKDSYSFMTCNAVLLLSFVRFGNM